MFDKIDLHVEQSDHRDEEAFRKIVCETLQHLTHEVHRMRQEVQQLVANVAELKSDKASSDLAWQTMVTQTTDLKAQVAALQTQAAAGGVDADDIAAIVQSANDVHDVAVGMQQAVPANTPAAAPDASKG